MRERAQKLRSTNSCGIDKRLNAEFVVDAQSSQIHRQDAKAAKELVTRLRRAERAPAFFLGVFAPWRFIPLRPPRNPCVLCVKPYGRHLLMLNTRPQT